MVFLLNLFFGLGFNIVEIVFLIFIFVKVLFKWFCVFVEWVILIILKGKVWQIGGLLFFILLELLFFLVLYLVIDFIDFLEELEVVFEIWEILFLEVEIFFQFLFSLLRVLFYF